MGRTEERIGVILDIKGDVNKIKSSIGSLQKDLLGVQLPKGLGKDFETRMRRLSDEIENFEKLASKAGNSFEGAKQIDSSYKKILEYARKVEISFSAIKKEANIDTSKFFPKEILERIEKAEAAVANYEKAIEKGNDALQKQKKSLKDIEAALSKNEKKRVDLISDKDSKKATYDKVKKEQGKVKTTKSNELAQEQKNLEILKQRKIALDAEKAAVEDLAKKKKALEKSEKDYSSRKAQYGANDSKAKGEKQKLNADKKAYEEALQTAKKYGDTIRSISDIELDQSKTASSIDATKTAIKGLGKEIDAADDKIKKAQNAFDTAAQDLRENETAAKSLQGQMTTLKTAIEQTENAAKAKGLKELVKSLDEIGVKIDPATSSLEDIQKTINNLKPDAIKAITDALDKAGVSLDELDVDLTNLGRKNSTFQEGAKGAKEMKNQLDQLKGHVQQFFSLTNSVMLFRRGIQQAIETVKELDKAMTETAVVTDFSVGDMWNELPRYTKAANELGATTLGAYETMTLFYQQGLKTNEAFEIGTETMKMARIAGLDYANATNLMTAALRGFNMELNNTSASKINDVYSELAAITAADTNEIASAMTKTASIANSANMEFETTAALLSQIIETTREPAETAGTALKTIIARFTEMKKATSDIVSVEGEEVSVNKVEAALKSAGVALRDVNGEFRDLDDVFLELSSKWNGLDMMTQRYIATMAAGSRQQSRFIAMMQDYERTIELVDAAYNSSGASQRQFEKTQESLESKLNKLKNAWDEFLMGISNSTVIKKGVDALTGLLNVINKLTGNSGIGKLLVAIGALKGGSAIFNNLFNASNFGKAFSRKFDFKFDASKLIDLQKMGTATEKLKKFSETVTKMTGKGILEVLKNGLGSIGETALETGKSFWNLGKAGLEAGKSLIGGIGKALLAIPGWGWAAAATIAAVGAGLYALWKNSGLQTAKRQAEADAATLKETQDYVSGLTEKVRELDDAWESLTEGQSNLDGLVEGTIEWTEQVQALNQEVQTLLQKYPELYKYLNIDQNTGQWSLDETGYKEYQATTKREQRDAKNRELYETAASNYTSSYSEALNKASQTDEMVNFGLTVQSTEETYLEALQDAYRKVHAPGEQLNKTVEDILKDEKTLEYINNMTGSQDFWGSGAADEKTALEYFQTKEKAKQQLKAEENAYRKNYLASSKKYGEKVQDAVIQSMNKLPSSFETLQEQRGKYAGDTHGKGAKMQGEAKEGEEKTVQQIMKARGYELVDGNKNWYKNSVTGKYVNVDSVGGGVAGEEVKKKTVNGEEVTMETWSNEYVRDLGRQDDLRSQQEKNMEILGDTFAKDINLAKIAAGDLSADLTQIGADFKKDIKNGDEVLFNYSETYDNFVKTRSKTMDELNERYNNAFQATETKRVKGEEIKKYTQSTYEAAQATIEFEESVEALGAETKQNLASIFLAFKDLEDGVELNVESNLDDQTKKLIEGYNKAGISADKLQDYVKKIDMSSAINGAQQLKRDLEEGGQEAMLAATVISSDKLGSQFFSVGNQFKELIAGEQWLEKTQASLTEIYKLEGQITADNIRELAEENSDLAAVLDTNSLKASGFAKMMEAVESGTISLTDVTSDLIKVYDGLYYSADLAGEAIARLESAKIKESDTKVGNIYSESYGAVKDLMKRGAYGDTQIDDYMNQMLGGSAWADALANAKGNKQDAVNAINKQYGLSANKGNLYGSWKKQISNAGGSIAGGAIKMGADGSISYDLSNIQSTQQLVEKIMEDTGVTKEYAEAMLGDMKTYSTTLGTDLEKLDKIGTLNDFVNSRTTKDGVLNISEAEKASFAQARGQTVDEFEKDLLANEKINSLEDRKYSDSGYYYTTEDEEGNKTVKFTDAEIEDGAKNQLIDEIKKTTEEGFTEGTNEAFKGIENLEDLQAKLEVELAAGGGPLTEETINSLIGVDSVREIMLDPNLDDTQKQDLLNQILTPTYAGAANGLAQGLLGQESMANAQAIADYMGVEMYNKMGAQLTQAMDLLATHKVEIPFSFSGLNVTLPSNAFTDALGFGGKTITLLGSGGVGSKFVIGGSGTGLSSSFSGKSSSYTPKTVNVGGITGGQTGGKGNAYTKGNDNANDPTQSGSNGSGKDDKNYTNPKLENINNQLESLERQYENKEIGALDYETRKRDLLTQQRDILDADIRKDYANSKYKDYFYYDKASDSYLLNEAKFNKANDATKNAIMEEYERINSKNDDLNEIEDLLKQLVVNTRYDTSNEKAKLEYLDKDVKNNRIDLSTHSSEQKTLLSSQIDKLTKQFTEEFNNSANKDMFVYDKASGQLLLNEEKLLELSEEEQKTVKEEWEYLKGIVDEASDLQDTLDEMVDKYSSANEEATLDYLNWLKENGLISVEEYDKAVKAEEQAIAANALADFLERVETDKNFESGLLYRDENTGMVEINQEMYKGLNATDQKEALNLQKTLNDLFLTYLKNSGEGEKQGNQFDTTNQDTKLEEIERQRSKGNLGATAYTKSRNKELNDKYDNLSATFQKELNESKNKDMFTYDETTGELLLNMEKFNQLTEASQEEVKQEYETLKNITDQMKDIEDILDDINYGKYSTHNQQEQQTWDDYRYANNYSSVGDYSARSQKTEEEEIDILSRKADAYDVRDEDVEAGRIAQDKNGKYYIADKAWYNGLGKEQQKAIRQKIRFYNKALDEDLKKGRIGQDENGKYVVKDQDWYNGLSDKEKQSVKNRLYAYNKAPSDGYIDPDILSGDLIYDPVTGQVSVNYDKGEREQWDKPTTQALEQKASDINADNIRNQSLKDKVEERKKTDKYDTAQIDRDLQDLERKYANGEMSPFEYSKQWRELQEKKVYNNRQQAGKALINELYDQNWDYVFENGQWTYKTKDGVELTDDQKAEAAAAAQLLNNNDSDKWDYNAETGRFEFTKDWDKDLTEEQKEEQQKLLEDANKNIGADPNSIYWTYNPDTGEIDFTDAFFALDDDSQTSVLQDLEEKYGYSELMKEAIDVLKDPDYKVAGNRERDQAANARRSNISSDMDSLSRREQELAQYNNLISKLPQEVQGPLTLMTSAASMAFNAERSQLLRADEAAVRENMAVAKSENDWLFNQTDENGNKLEYVYWDEATDSWKKNEELWGKLAPEVIDDAEAAFNELDGYAKEINNIKAQRGDTIFQKPFYMAEDAVEDMQRAFDSTTSITDGVNKAFDVLEKKLGLSSKAFDNLEGLIGDYLESKGITDDSTMSGLNWIDEEQFGAIKNSKLWEYMGEDTKKFFEMAFVQDDDGFLVKDFISSAFGTSGELFGFTGDLLNPEMLGIGLDMLNTTKGMIDQAKQWVEQIIGYITQATQVLIDAWTNREDYLFNFLKQIEKHLQEYEKLQRYSTQLEKGRLSSSQDILNNWNDQWKSLQLQLEEQNERLEERQKALDRSRFNPFSLISGWDPTSDTLYENREVKMLWDIIIGLGEAFAPLGTGTFFSQINQLYEDYDKRVQEAYEDRLAAEQALLDLEDQRIELVKVGSEEATEFEQKLLDSLIQKEQEAIDELSRLNESVTEANQKLLSTLQNNLDKIRQERENEKKEEELGEKERRLAYLRQDTSGANMMEIKKLEKEIDEGHEDYTDNLIDQKISELEKQNELAAEQRQQQIDLLQGQLDYAEKYGLYWDAIYGMLYKIDDNGKAVLNSDNFDLDGNIRENSELAKLLGTFSDRMGMSTWSQVLDNEETKRLGRYYGAFIGMNGVDGNWANYWALVNPRGNDPRYSYPEQEIPDGLWGVLYKLEIGIKKYFGNSNLGLVNGAGRIEESFKNFFGKMFGYDEWANYDFTGFNPAHVESTVFGGIKNTTDDIKAWFASGFDNLTKGIKSGTNIGGTQNYGAVTENYNFNIGTVGESISLNEMIDKVTSAIKGLFTPNGVAYADKGH